MIEPGTSAPHERRRELERLAWGSDASDADRDRARAELAALAAPPAAAAGAPPARSLAEDDHLDGHPATGTARRRMLARVLPIAAGAAALVIAAVVLTTTVHDRPAGSDVDAGERPTVQAGAGAEEPGDGAAPDEGVPGEDTPADAPAGPPAAFDVFTRVQIPADLPAQPPADLDPATFRLLDADEGGWATYAAEPVAADADAPDADDPETGNLAIGAAERPDGPCLVLRGPGDILAYSCAQSTAEFLAAGGLALMWESDDVTMNAAWQPDGTSVLERQ